MRLLNSEFPILCSRRRREGQSLIEVLVAVSLGAIFVIGAFAVLSPALKTSGDALRVQAGAALAKQLLENATVLAESNWHAIDALATSSANHYYLITSSVPFTAATGTESIAVGTTTYARAFYLEDVYRDTGSNGKISASGSYYDPSTKKITVLYSWGPAPSSSITSYLVRAMDQVFTVTDWSGGGGQAGPVTATSVNSQFSTSSSIDATTTPGSVVISGF